MNPQPGIYGWSNGKGGVHWYRQAEPLRVATQRGINTGAGIQLNDEICESFDTILVHMLWDTRNSEAWEKLAAQGDHRLIFDIDDVMWEPDWQPFRNHYTPEVLAQVWTNIKLAHVVTTPSAVIAEKIAKVNPNVWICPNTVPEWLLTYGPTRRPHPAPVTRYLLGYQGSPSHARDFPLVLMRELLEFLAANPAWGLHFWGPNEPIDGWPPGRLGYTPWADSVPAYYRSLSMDIGIGPLADTPFNRGKSGLRAIEYAALGIPAVLSSGPAYTPWVDNGVTGLLIDRWEQFGEALTLLARDHDLRRSMGFIARTRAAKWTTEANLSKWLEAWNSV